jgi:hypothetical protein
MSDPTRNSSNPPNYYYKLDTRQQRNWRRTTKKIERNEQARSTHPPYHPTSNINIVHLHHQTEITIINQLIQQAKITKRYTMDTESQKRQSENHGALIQIEMVNSINCSTVILLEIYHMPDVDSLLFERIKELWSIIFNSGNEIITWGPIANELENFQHMEWIKIGKTKKINLQYLFQEWHDGTLAHPETERRVAITGVPMDTPGDDDDSDEEELFTSYNEPTIVWSLQSAVATALNKFLDKLLTINDWNCGLDLTLETWRSRLFSKKYYDMQVEKQQRIKMIDYAVHDCTSVTELYFTMYPELANRNIINENTTTTLTTVIETPTTTSMTINDYLDNLSDISEDELIEFLKPKFNKREPTLPPPDNEPTSLIINTTRDEIEEFESTSQPQQQQNQVQKLPATKAERQKIKNEKFKLKKKYRPDFQNKIRRPIYHKYNYQNIRAQLRDDNIHHTHQITIDQDKGEVRIGFKSKHEQEQATATIKINYFSRTQFNERWDGKN